MVKLEPVKKMSKKDLLRLVEELIFKLQGEEEEEERLAGEKAQQVKEANIAWDDVQAKIEADYQLAQRLQAQEQEELTDEEKARLFVQFLEQRRKYFVAKRAEEKRNRPPTRARQRSIITKLVEESFKKAEIELVEESSKKAEAEITHESSLKRAGEELEQESSKKQKLEEDKESEELKQCLEIVPDDGEDVTINATPLSTKSLTIMLKNFDREDLEVLWSIVKERFKKTEPVNYMDNFLLLNLKTMFEHHVEDNMFNDVKLQVDYKCEMAFELLRLVKKQLKEGYERIVRIKSLLEVTATKVCVTADKQKINNYARQVVVDNVVNRRAHEFLKVIEKMRGEANIPTVLALREKLSSLTANVKEHKGNLDRMMLESQKWVGYQVTLSALESKVNSLEADKARLEVVKASLRREIEELKQDRRDLVSKVITYAAIELVHSVELGRLVGKLVSFAITYGYYKTYEQVAAMKDPFDLSKVRGCRSSYQKEHTQASNDFATATFL
ncbi:hypothetical protein Tco_1575249 [Tanacetum coccineum]